MRHSRPASGRLAAARALAFGLGMAVAAAPWAATEAVASTQFTVSTGAVAGVHTATRTQATGRGTAGWRTVGYDGISLRVPGSWPVLNLHAHPATCPRLDVHAVYLGRPGPDPACPAAGLGAKTEAVQISRAAAGSPDSLAATRHVVIGGHQARTNPGQALTHTVIDIVGGIDISRSYGHDRRLIAAVQASIAVTTSGALDHVYQNTSTGAWTWGPALGGNGTIANTPSPILWPDGRVEVFYEQPNGELGHVYQFAANGATGWAGPSTMGGTVLGSPRAFVNANGTPEILTLNSSHQIQHTYHPSSGWQNWSSLGGTF